MSRSRTTTYISPLTSTSALSSGSNSTRSSTWTERTREPTPTTRHHASRLPPISVVAGIRMPPVDLRSPGSRSSATSTRSCSIRIGVFSPVIDVGADAADAELRLLTSPRSLHDLADQPEHDDDPDHTADDLDDVVGARRAVRRHEVPLDLVDLALRDRLRTRPVLQLVDRRGQPLAGHLDVALDRAEVPVSHTHSSSWPSSTNVTVCRMSERSE